MPFVTVIDKPSRREASANVLWFLLQSAQVWVPRAIMVGMIFFLLPSAVAQRQMENLGRGVTAMNQGDGKIFVNWRMLGTDPDNIAFNIYRATGDAQLAKLNQAPLTISTCYQDAGVDVTKDNSYFVRPIVNGKEGERSRAFLNKIEANAPVRQYFEVPLSLPQGYTPNDASVGDLDGDGEFEMVLKSEQRPRDTASTGLTGETILQGYKIDGSLLWTINLGKNIREGAHYCQFMVYDLDGDGIAEIACKTADGTVDGKGVVIGDAKADWRDITPGSRTFGRVLNGPEFFTIFDGKSGAALATADYIPGRGNLGGWGGIGGNGRNDTVGNRVDRFLGCVAYLDGKLPSVVMCRGYYGRSGLAAWDWREGKLTPRWVFDTDSPGTGRDGKPHKDYAGMGAHSVSVADLDGDGRDEIIYHSMVVDPDGKGFFTTGLRHGDALHVGDFDPSRPGLEVFGIHENEGDTVRFQTPGAALYDGRSGHIIWSAGPGVDVGRGLSADIDPRYPGEEMWGGPGGLHNCKGESIGPAPRAVNFAIWWDGDFLREILDRNQISKWDWENSTLTNLFTAEGCSSNNGSKGTPALSADLFGDWREEVIFRTSDNKSLRIYSTTIATTHRIYTLMHDPQYRLAIAWQNVGYNQPPHPGFYLGDAMKAPPRPAISTTVQAKSGRR